MIKNIQVSVEIPDPIDEVYVLSVKMHGSFGGLESDSFYIAPEAYTNVESAKKAMGDYARNSFSYIDKAVNKCVDPMRVYHAEAVLTQTTWEATVYVTPNNGKSYRESELPFVVTYYIHRVSINKR